MVGGLAICGMLALFAAACELLIRFLDWQRRRAATVARLNQVSGAPEGGRYLAPWGPVQDPAGELRKRGML